ncbi:hypothetical protein [Fodinicola acaciae]|uniref:hypothetical protein n=1 Tax=Fodinicola acaciae TaxID=2681555 RepID=UPI001C9E4B1B|nr:hypothetical protein [Fodinicola acaciae]
MSRRTGRTAARPPQQGADRTPHSRRTRGKQRRRLDARTARPAGRQRARLGRDRTHQPNRHRAYADAGYPWVHEADVAEIAVAALLTDDHLDAAYTVTGPEK